MAKRQAPPAIEHFERCFGKAFDEGRTLDPGIVGLCFNDKPAPGYSTLVTARISKHSLSQAEGDALRIELVFAGHSTQVEAVNPFAIPPT